MANNNELLDDLALLEFNKHNADVKAHDFNKFINKIYINKQTILDIIKTFYIANNKHLKFAEERKLPVAQSYLKNNLDWQKDIVKKFFLSLNKNLGEKVANIIDGKDKNYLLKFNYKEETSCCSTEKNENFITINISISDSFDSLKTFVHEITHAVSKRKITELNAVLGDEESKNLVKEYSSYESDCVVEVESFIIEMLFFNYLSEQHIINSKDWNKFINNREMLMQSNLSIILQENVILSKIPKNATNEDIEKFKKSLKVLFIKKRNHDCLINRLTIMSQRKQNRNRNSQYLLRYVVAEMISQIWFQNYSRCSNFEKRSMITTLVSYLNNSDHANIKLSCNCLLGKTLSKTIEEYLTLKKEKVI